MLRPALVSAHFGSAPPLVIYRVSLSLFTHPSLCSLKICLPRDYPLLLSIITATPLGCALQCTALYTVHVPFGSYCTKQLDVQEIIVSLFAGLFCRCRILSISSSYLLLINFFFSLNCTQKTKSNQSHFRIVCHCFPCLLQKTKFGFLFFFVIYIYCSPLATPLRRATLRIAAAEKVHTTTC